MYRYKSYCLGVDTDSALRDDGGLKRFQVTEQKLKGDPLDWEHLTVAADAGPDVTCLLNCLEGHLMCNITRTPDTSHGAHNDVLLTVLDCLLGPFLHHACDQ